MRQQEIQIQNILAMILMGITPVDLLLYLHCLLRRVPTANRTVQAATHHC